jgi:LytTr DNA-binding domain-containing protein
MASASKSPLERLRTEPLLRGPLALMVLVVWLAGAIYCSGYEKLLTGLDNWPGSLAWSAAAVLPWLALFEWSKTIRGRRVTASLLKLAIALVVTALLSLLLELILDRATDHRTVPIALPMLRRLPAIGACLLLVLWSRSRVSRQRVADANLEVLAPAIEWVEAADNYIELHLAGRIVLRRMTMRDAEAVLTQRGFIRIHRRYMVNSAKIALVRGGERVRLSSGAELPVGRAFAANLQRAA